MFLRLCQVLCGAPGETRSARRALSVAVHDGARQGEVRRDGRSWFAPPLTEFAARLSCSAASRVKVEVRLEQLKPKPH